MPRRLPIHKLKTNAREIKLEGAKVYHLPDWNRLTHPQRLAVIRQVAMMRGRDPRIAKLAVKIFRKYKVQPRDYPRQAAALLRWVQDPKNIYYANESGERLQDPIYTIKAGHADCDDSVLLLCSLFESVRLPWRLVLSGRGPRGEKVRYIEGQHPVPQAKWVHIYCMVGDRPFTPKRWFFAETTIQKVPLGWDVVDGDASFLPEMARNKYKGPEMIMPSPKAPKGFRPSKLPKRGQRSAAYDMAYGSVARRNQGGVGTAVGSAVAEEVEEGGLDWVKVAGAVATGVAVSVFTQLALDFIRGKGMWEETGSVTKRFSQTTGKLFQQSALLTPPGLDV